MNIEKDGYLNFDGREKTEETIRATWSEFREALSTNKFKYNDIEGALNYTFLHQLDDFFEKNNCKKLFTKKLRDVFIKKNEVLRGTKLKIDETPDYERFLPKSEYIEKDNRFSPKGVEWLYLVVGKTEKGNDNAKNCTIKECKAEIGQRFGVCHFQMDDKFRKSKLVDLTIACDCSWEEWEEKLKKEFEKIARKSKKLTYEIGVKIPASKEKVEMVTKKCYSFFYAKLLSQEIFLPVDSDKEYMYLPFQCLALYFKQLGYDGIIYSSVVYPTAKNVVLFDKLMAKPYGNIEAFIVDDEMMVNN